MTMITENELHAKLLSEVKRFRDEHVSVAYFGPNKNSATIQAALDYLKSVGGGELKIPGGTYDITEVVRIPSNVRVFAQGQVTFVRKADINAIVHNDAEGVAGGYTANSNIIVEGITFDANNTVYPGNTTQLAIGHATAILIKACVFKNNTTWHDLEINGSRFVHVLDCEFLNYQGTSESLQCDYMGGAGQFPWFGPFDDTPTIYTTIEKCKFYGPGLNSDLTTPNATIKAIGNHSFKVGTVTSYLKIINCTFDGWQNAISQQDVYTMWILDNLFIDCVYAVTWTEQQNNSYNWTISNNTFIHRNLNAIETAIESRFILGTTNAPVKYLEGLIIEGNTVRANSTNHIGGTWRKVVIANNTFEFARRNGVYIYGGSDISITGNVFKNNNRRNEVDRADVVVGNNGGVLSEGVTITGNTMDKIILSTGSLKVKAADNIVKSQLINNANEISVTSTGNIIVGSPESSQKIYELFNGSFVSGAKTLTLPAGVASLGYFEELRFYGIMNIGGNEKNFAITTTSRGFTTIKLSETHSVIFLASSGFDLYWLEAQLNVATRVLSITFNRRRTATGIGEDGNFNGFTRIEGIKYL